MQLKASTDYGMRAILYLAAQGTTCSSKDIANDMSIPRDYDKIVIIHKPIFKHDDLCCFSMIQNIQIGNSNYI